MPILSSSIRRPASPVAKTYAPAGGQKYKVRDGDSWVSLASGRGMNPMDLVRYNYPGLPADPQQAAREVNWYLQEYVGCTKVTANNRNYAFSTSASPGEIWLPIRPPAVPLTADEIAKKVVLDTLRGPTISSMQFGVGRLFIPSSNYELVAKAVEGGHIKVREVPTLAGSAVYYWGDNRIDLPPYGGSPGLGDRALIIHECTHAIIDVRMIAVRVEETEGLAYVAQALYSRLNGSTHRHIVSQDPHDVVSWTAWQLIFDESARLAEIVSRKRKVTEDEAAALFWAIKNANFYRARVGKTEINDGVGDAFYNSL